MSWECPCGFINSNEAINCMGCGSTLDETRMNLDQKLNEVQAEGNGFKTYEIVIIVICAILMVVIGLLTGIEEFVPAGFGVLPHPKYLSPIALSVLFVIGIIYAVLAHIFNWGKYCNICARKASPFINKCKYCGGDFK